MTSSLSISLRYDCLGVRFRYDSPVPPGDAAKGLLALVGLPAALPDPPRKAGIGFDSLRIRLAALLFENARLTWVPPARAGGAGGVADIILADEDEEEDGRVVCDDAE